MSTVRKVVAHTLRKIKPGDAPEGWWVVFGTAGPTDVTAEAFAQRGDADQQVARLIAAGIKVEPPVTAADWATLYPTFKKTRA